MKNVRVLMMALIAIPLLLASCQSKKQVVKDEKTAAPDSVEQATFLKMVNDNVAKTQFVTSKLKFTVEYGPQQISLTGNLKMKRDDVIRLQLMAFGFVEAGRIEFTKDYVLIMDRINKQYLKAPYSHVSFLRNSGINFYTLQALFWNELFVPGRQSVDQNALNKFTASMGEDEVVINLEEGKMNYSWLANQKTGRINMANISYRDQFKGNTQLNWDYKAFSNLGSKPFPSDMGVTLTMPEKEIKLGIKLTYLGNESEWETRTTVSDKYREVMVDEILRRFMAL